VERPRQGLPIAEDDRDTWYTGGDAGRLTHPCYRHTA
jgi:hypothetical protein